MKSHISIYHTLNIQFLKKYEPVIYFFLNVCAIVIFFKANF